MPNHVFHKIMFMSSNYSAIKEIKELFERGDVANELIPYPSEFKELDDKAMLWRKEHPDKLIPPFKDGFNSGGYEWCVHNWGSKWGLYSIETFDIEEDIDERVDKPTYVFSAECQSAWSPPFPVFDVLSERFPDVIVDIVYEEEGEQFSGYRTYYNGNVVFDKEFGSQYERVSNLMFKNISRARRR